MQAFFQREINHYKKPFLRLMSGSRQKRHALPDWNLQLVYVLRKWALLAYRCELDITCFLGLHLRSCNDGLTVTYQETTANWFAHLFTQLWKNLLIQNTVACARNEMILVPVESWMSDFSVQIFTAEVICVEFLFLKFKIFQWD